MAVCIRLSRFGRLHRPYFRIVAIDRRNHREGVASEVLGSYDPLLADKNVQINIDRVQAWVNQGARISPSLKNLLKFSGYQVPTTAAAVKPKAKKAAPSPKPKPTAKGTYVAPSRRAVRQHQAKLKAVRKVATAEAEAKAKAAKAAAAPAAPAAPEAPKT